MEYRQYRFYDQYQIFMDGRVYSKKTSKFLKPQEFKGYLRVFLCHNGEAKTFKVHRLVASCFIPNPNNCKQVNHIDGNKHNNSVENLEWVTAKDNMRHAHKNGLSKKFTVGQYVGSKLIKKYESILVASNETGISQSGIVYCLAGGRYRVENGKKVWINANKAGGYEWRKIS